MVQFRVWFAGLVAAWFFCFHVAAFRVGAFSWGSEPQQEGDISPMEKRISHYVPVKPNTTGGDHSRYEVALRELEELESEPLCHRIAARLLVNNCQILDGRDEATILTDSGRSTRDFVDSFAASLAICDLERGNFAIPAACSKFREAALAEITTPTKPHLHVFPAEIDGCLKGLSRSDSAWNTWVSYRHKALRFCEAARPDNERHQSIHLFQKITKIMAKLTMDVENELHTRLHDLGKKLGDTNAELGRINPYISNLRRDVSHVGKIVSGVLVRGAEETAANLKSGLQEAQNLLRLLETVFTRIQENESIMAHTHNSALRAVSSKVGEELDIVASSLQSAMAISGSLDLKFGEWQSRTEELAQKQNILFTDMEKLVEVADGLAVKQEQHQQSLTDVQETTEKILRTLNSVSDTAETFQNSILGGLGLANWWPYFVCPATTLVIGSYGLPPSAFRNVVLFGLGEAAAFVVSVANQYSTVLSEAPEHVANESVSSNVSAGADSSVPAINDFTKDEALRRN